MVKNHQKIHEWHAQPSKVKLEHSLGYILYQILYYMLRPVVILRRLGALALRARFFYSHFFSTAMAVERFNNVAVELQSGCRKKSGCRKTGNPCPSNVKLEISQFDQKGVITTISSLNRTRATSARSPYNVLFELLVSEHHNMVHFNTFSNKMMTKALSYNLLNNTRLSSSFT